MRCWVPLSKDNHMIEALSQDPSQSAFLHRRCGHGLLVEHTPSARATKRHAQTTHGRWPLAPLKSIETSSLM